MDSEDVEDLAKQTLLSTEDVSVKKRRQACARKAAATRKQKSARQKSSDKEATARNEFWCLCGGPESGNMIACDNPSCPIEWFHFECLGLMDTQRWKVVLHLMCCLTFSKLSLFRNALLQCRIHIPTKFNNSQQVLFRCIKRKLMPYETTEYFVPDQFSVNSFFLFCFCFFCLFAFYNPFCSQGEGNLISRFSPGARGFGI